MPMFLKLSDQISECLGYAVDARERADAAADPSCKANFLDMERRWLQLVESYRFVERAARFLLDGQAAGLRPLKSRRRQVCWSLRARPQAKISRRAF